MPPAKRGLCMYRYFVSQNMFVDELSELEKVNITFFSPNVEHMLCMHIRPHCRREQLPL